MIPVGKTNDKVWHRLPVDEVVQSLDVNLSAGLSLEETARRQKEFGPNCVSARRSTPWWMKFLKQFHQPLIYILLTSTGIAAAMGEWVDASVIFGVAFINAVIGYVQEAKAEKAIQALAKMVLTEATVRRGGEKLRIPSAQLVPGDVVLLQSGDRVPADLRLLLYVILGLAVLIFVAGILRGKPWPEMFMAAIALAVGAIPEGLPAVVTITLAIGVGRMVRRNAIFHC